MTENTTDQLLNIDSKLYSNCKSFNEKFELLATSLLNNVTLVINTNICKLEEVEIYYNSSNHDDKYVHKDKDQLKNSEWYFHKYKNGTYKSGTYKGLDITFGNNKDIYGGILIRAIVTNNGDLVIGPCKTVEYILDKTKFSSVDKLNEQLHSKNVFDVKNVFHLVLNDNVNNTDMIFKGPRVGLSLKYPTYLMKDYRYLKQPSKTLKYKNTLISCLFKNNVKVDDICKLTNINKKTVESAIKEYIEGTKLTKDEVNNMSILGKDINKLYGYYCDD